jgi:uncharacterized protein (TIGR02600 family)
MFGSLPRRLWTGNFGSHPLPATAPGPWQTLLFRPEPGHPGAGDPPDHLWLDLFWMPVVEPYAISEPFSTAGKINMNYAIEPFAYIKRATGMIGLLRSEKLTAYPTDNARSYKSRGAIPQVGISGSNLSDIHRLSMDIHQTLTQFDAKFATGDVFVSPSQICEMQLVPLDSNGSSTQTPASMPGFWNSHAITGDNTREKPYTDLQGRLTTKSNTYTVHYRVQAVRKAPGSPANVWNESSDRVVGEYRGSTTIERYITPKDERIPDYAAEYAADANANLEDLGHYYKWRVINTRQFAP